MTDREFVRQTLAVLAYRSAKTLRGAPDSFATFRAEGIGNSPLWIVSHMGDLFECALVFLRDAGEWPNYKATSWDEACRRFFDSLKKFDDYMASDEPIRGDLMGCYNGPIVDALTHTGQLAMLRRLCGSPIKGEGYDMADIQIGRVGFDQPAPDPNNEFD